MKEFEINEDIKKIIKRVFDKERKKMSDEIKDMVKKISEQIKTIKSDGERIKLRNKCEKLKKFYVFHFGKYPEILDNWIKTLTNTLTP